MDLKYNTNWENITEVKKVKKDYSSKLIVFLGICLLSVFIYNTNVQIQKDRRTIKN